MHPVIFVGGFMASNLRASWTSEPSHAARSHCPPSAKNRKMWLSLRQFLPWNSKCYFETMRLDWDPVKKEYRDTGVQIETEAWVAVPGVPYVQCPPVKGVVTAF